MHGKQQAIDGITGFLRSDEKGLLITGTYQFKKHYLVMAVLDKYFKNANILFRINSMQNIPIDSFTPLKKQPKAGESVKIGNNYYQFDALYSSATWRKSGREFDFAIVYPIDAMFKEHGIEPLVDLRNFKTIDKLFLSTWTDWSEHDYSRFTDYYTAHVIYDAEEDDPAYHKRVLDLPDMR